MNNIYYIYMLTTTNPGAPSDSRMSLADCKWRSTLASCSDSHTCLFWINHLPTMSVSGLGEGGGDWLASCENIR